jgi:hypothetical protein
MRPCDLTTGLGQLTDAIATLKDRWSETKNVWNDDSSQLIEKKYLEEIPTRLRFLFIATQRLAEVMEKAQRECEDPAALT